MARLVENGRPTPPFHPPAHISIRSTSSSRSARLDRRAPAHAAGGEVLQKGGTGKTTVARCLAVAFERSVQASAIIDMDPQASASLWAKRREADLLSR